MNHPSPPPQPPPTPPVAAAVLPATPAAAPVSPLAVVVPGPAAAVSGLPALDLPPDAATAWAPSLAEAFVGLACDLALVLDAQGTIQSVAAAAEVRLQHPLSAWIGQSLAACLSADSRHKAQDLLDDVARDGLARRREVTLLTEPPTAMAFAALRLGPAGPLLLLGQDLRAAVQLQQRFLLAQRDLEQGYQQALDQLAQRPAALPTADAAAAMAHLLPAAARLLAPHSVEPAARSGARDPVPNPARCRVDAEGLGVASTPGCGRSGQGMRHTCPPCKLNFRIPPPPNPLRPAHPVPARWRA
jgi:hypothetical protein